jgi:multidrug resistance efflux pump
MKRLIPIIVIIAAIGGGYWWYTNRSVDAAPSNALVGSGSIEAETIAITAELGGRIMAVKAAEGDEVRAGQILVKIDPSSLLAQQAQLEAALATAQANLAAVSAPSRPEDIAAAEAQLAQAQVARDGAKLTWQTAQAVVNNPHELAARLNQAQARVTEAQKNLELAQVNLKKAEIQAEAASRNQSNHAALVQNEVAQKQQTAAQVALQMAQVVLSGANQQVELLRQLRDYPLSLISQANTAQAAYIQAEAAVQVAEANLALVQANSTPEDIAIAQAQVTEAAAALAALQVQLDKLTLTAPRAGLVSQKLVNPGELAAPGAMLLELSDIDTVDLTVYIPETQIGHVKVGQKAQVEVDAYPGEIFEGQVSFIAPQAEFTPRNIQTQEERVNLVFAVKITLANPGHRLKPGMPADANLLANKVQEDKNGETIAESKPMASPTPQPTITPTLQTSSLSTLQPANPPTLQPSPTATPTPAMQVEVLSWGLNVRSGPGVTYPVVAHLAKGAVVDVLEVDPSAGWLRVPLPTAGQSGWITGSSTYVRVVK